MDFSVGAGGQRQQGKLFSFPFDSEKTRVVKISVDKNNIIGSGAFSVNEVLRAVIVAYTDNDKNVVWGVDTAGTVDNDILAVTATAKYDFNSSMPVPFSGLSLQVDARRVEVYLFSGQNNVEIQGVLNVSEGELIPLPSRKRFILNVDSTLGIPNVNSYVDIPHNVKQFSIAMEDNNTLLTDNVTPFEVFQVGPRSLEISRHIITDDTQRIDISPDALGLRISPLESSSRNILQSGYVTFHGEIDYVENDFTAYSERSTVAATSASDITIPSDIKRKWVSIRNPDATNSLYISYSATPTAANARFILAPNESLQTTHRGTIYIRTSSGNITVPYENDY